MIERLGEIPAGVIGLRASGKLTRDDYRKVMEPALREATDSGDARVLFVHTALIGTGWRSSPTSTGSPGRCRCSNGRCRVS